MTKVCNVLGPISFFFFSSAVLSGWMWRFDTSKSHCRNSEFLENLEIELGKILNSVPLLCMEYKLIDIPENRPNAGQRCSISWGMGCIRSSKVDNWFRARPSESGIKSDAYGNNRIMSSRLRVARLRGHWPSLSKIARTMHAGTHRLLRLKPLLSQGVGSVM